jgi:hypothetical protein
MSQAARVRRPATLESTPRVRPQASDKIRRNERRDAESPAAGTAPLNAPENRSAQRLGQNHVPSPAIRHSARNIGTAINRRNTWLLNIKPAIPMSQVSTYTRQATDTDLVLFQIVYASVNAPKISVAIKNQRESKRHRNWPFTVSEATM